MASGVASQPGSCKLTLGSFNFGFQQSMMTGNGYRAHRENFARVCAKLVEDGDCDLLFGCEVGAFRKGFSTCLLYTSDAADE